MANPIEPSGPDAPSPSASPLSPDPVTADLLAKHSAGEKLTASEYGKLGAFKARLGRLFGGSPGTAAKPAAGPTRNALLVAPVAAVETPGDGLGPVAPDPRLVQRTTAALLKSADSIARRYVAREARKAGADDKTMARFDSAAALPPATQELMVETSPDVLAALGMDPSNYPLTVFCGALGLWGANLWLCVDELKKLQEERKPKPEAPATKVEATAK
jgi:hypothetical protein